jgi:hypothetical protein
MSGSVRWTGAHPASNAAATVHVGLVLDRVYRSATQLRLPTDVVCATQPGRFPLPQHPAREPKDLLDDPTLSVVWRIWIRSRHHAAVELVKKLRVRRPAISRCSRRASRRGFPTRPWEEADRRVQQLCLWLLARRSDQPHLPRMRPPDLAQGERPGINRGVTHEPESSLTESASAPHPSYDLVWTRSRHASASLLAAGSGRVDGEEPAIGLLEARRRALGGDLPDDGRVAYPRRSPPPADDRLAACPVPVLWRGSAQEVPLDP